MKKNEYLIYGYASVFSIEDSNNGIISKECFKKSVNSHRNQDYKSIALLWQHDLSSPIGRILSLNCDDYGLHIIAKINDQTTKSLESISLIYSQIINSFSIGFRIIRYQNLKQGREIIEADLLEVSIVTLPANKKAKIQKIQSLRNGKIKCLSESNLENSIFKAEMLIQKINLINKNKFKE